MIVNIERLCKISYTSDILIYNLLNIVAVELNGKTDLLQINYCVNAQLVVIIKLKVKKVNASAVWSRAC